MCAVQGPKGDMGMKGDTGDPGRKGVPGKQVSTITANCRAFFHIHIVYTYREKTVLLGLKVLLACPEKRYV